MSLLPAALTEKRSVLPLHSYLRYNCDRRVMEMRTVGRAAIGSYEALVNYDIPGQPPAYGHASRRTYLSRSTKRTPAPLSPNPLRSRN